MDPSMLLRRVPLLQDLAPDEIEKVTRVVREETLPGNTNVLEMGDPGRALYIILEGDVRVLYPGRSDEFELARLGPGDFFGEMALLNDEPRSATVRTLSDTRVLVVKQRDFRNILLDFPTTAVNVLEALSLRIRTADEQISALSDRAMRDTLTDLLNRRAFHERLNQEADRHQRYGDEFALILVDIDGFNELNDRFGRDMGDEVLRWMGRMLVQHTRAPDIPFRV
ncbi:MAG: GGDEF domain-containing protein, partial [Longimicrobiales bacterium]